MANLYVGITGFFAKRIGIFVAKFIGRELTTTTTAVELIPYIYTQNITAYFKLKLQSTHSRFIKIFHGSCSLLFAATSAFQSHYNRDCSIKLPSSSHQKDNFENHRTWTSPPVLPSLHVRRIIQLPPIYPFLSCPFQNYRSHPPTSPVFEKSKNLHPPLAAFKSGSRGPGMRIFR